MLPTSHKGLTAARFSSNREVCERHGAWIPAGTWQQQECLHTRGTSWLWAVRLVPGLLRCVTGSRKNEEHCSLLCPLFEAEKGHIHNARDSAAP